MATKLDTQDDRDLRRSRSRNSDLFNSTISFNSPLVSSRNTSPHPTPNKPKRQPKSAAPEEPPSPSLSLPEEVIHAIAVPTPLPRPSFGQPLKLRYSANRSYMLGLGEFSTVFLSAWRLRESITSQWQLCAVKRINPDRDSQKAAFNEAYILARLGSQRAFTSQTDLSVVPQDCQHIVRILAVKDEAHEDVEVIEPQSPSSLRGAKAFAQQNALAQGRRSPRQSLSATSTPLKPSSHHQASASTGNAHLQVPKNKTLSQLQHGSGVPHEDVRLDVPPLSPLSSMQTMQPDNPAHPIIPNRDQPSNPRSVPNEQPFRRAISLRDPSKNSGNKPSGSNEADAKKGMATVEEADKTGNAPRLLLVYELCPNGTVASFIRRNGGQIGRALWFKWARQIIAALAHCHSFGILHADVKTQNVLLTADLNSRLSDFGSSLAISPSDPPTEGLGLGTTAYNAPELVACPPHPFGLAADVYSAGIVLHTMITGKEPYSTCRNSVEQMLHVSRGGYWSWASRHVWDDSQSLPPPSGHSRPASLYSLASDEDSFPQHTSFSSSRASGSFSAGLSGSSRKGLTKQDVDFLLQTATPTGPHTSASHEEPGLHSSTSSQNYRAVSEEEQLLPVSSLASDDEDESPMTSPRLPSSPPSPAYKCHSRSASLKRSSGLKSYSGGSPMQYFLDGQDPVPEGIISLLEKMTSPKPGDRPTMRQVANQLNCF